MNRSIRLGLATLCLLASAAPALAQTPFFGKAGPLTVEIGDAPAQSQIVFLSSAPMEKFRGTATGITGTLKLGADAAIETLAGRIQVPVAAMKTGNDMRDEHMKGAEWLNAKAHPHIVFTIDKLESFQADGGKAKASAVGTFAMNGVSKRLTIPVDVAFNPKNGAVKVTGKFAVSLKDFNVAGKRGIVGSKVGETIEVEATFYGLVK